MSDTVSLGHDQTKSERDRLKETPRILATRNIHTDRLADKLNELLEAKITKVFCKDGELIYSMPMADNPSQVQALQIAARMLGLFPDEDHQPRDVRQIVFVMEAPKDARDHGTDHPASLADPDAVLRIDRV